MQLRILAEQGNGGQTGDGNADAQFNGRKVLPGAKSVSCHDGLLFSGTGTKIFLHCSA